MPAYDYSGPQLITVARGGWVTRKLALYVAGANTGGPLAPYGFFLVFEDGGGERVYTLPVEGPDEGPLLSRLLIPNLDGIIRIGPTPVHPSWGALVVKAWRRDVRADLPDLQARCSYRGCASPTLLFRVDYSLAYVTETSQDSRSTSLGGPTRTNVQSSESSTDVELGPEFDGVKVGGLKASNRRSNSDSYTTASAAWTSETGTSTSRQVGGADRISVKWVSAPPDL